MSIQLDREVTQDLERAASVEWQETNGLGGGAGTTAAGLNSRRGHGLLVAATPDGGRTLLLSRLDETIHVEGGSFDLGCNQFPGTIAPRGFQHLVSFTRDLFPVYEYEAGGVRLRKTVAAVDGENTTLVLYEVLEAPGPFILSLRPFVAARDARDLASANAGLSQETRFEDGVLRLHPQAALPEVFLSVPGADFHANPQWWYRFEYEADRRLGIDFQEDLWTPGVLGCELEAGGRLGVIVSTASPAGRDAFALAAKERKRRERRLAALPAQDGLARHLALLADSFLVRRGPQRTVVNAESQRDALMALPGLCLATGRHEDAKRILRSASGAKEPDPWLFVAAWKYLQATDDEAFVRTALLPVLRRMVQAGEGFEDQALRYNALEILAGLETRLGDPVEAMQLQKQAKIVRKELQEVPWTALALPFPLLPKAKAAGVLGTVSPEEVEPRLLGSYLTALVRANGAAGRRTAKQIVAGLEERLPELDLGDAVAVAELLRACVEDVQGSAKRKK
ncbi:MAG: glycogen debranching enzyme N-terminal domain-containing protein [Acidobacteriota bacterium]